MLYLIGLGLCDEKDITVKGLEVIKNCSELYLEAYTSILGISKEKLEEFYGKTITIADREFVESGCDIILEKAKTQDIAFLVVGDPFGATTHADLVIRAKDLNVRVRSIHNASILNAIGCCGLQLYTFGQTVSLVFFTPNWKPDSFYDRILSNRNSNLHTLCLLDIKVKEQSEENLLRGRKIYEAPRYMTVNQAIEQLLEIEDIRKQGAYSKDSLCVGIARIGHEDQKIVSGTMQQLLNIDFGSPLHSLIIPAPNLHILEEEMLKIFQVTITTTTL
eukprot:TRINITY_DN2551_c1_g1_i1.p1 TRINITY_DN2551_c1_g1~~TRINITY_DN2551_c1_g1_i1.p1  ORF type:complete len:276 (-),score=123.11 TRINITY_DN2551_c1_g1_i1:69-896(-)